MKQQLLSLLKMKQGIPTILSSIVSSQVDVHKEFGGVVPELAAKITHRENRFNYN